MHKQSNFVKIRVITPEAAGDAIRDAMGKAGAGVLGNYDFCSVSYPVVGRFKPMPGAHPAVGIVGKLETVSEEMIEVICESIKAKAVIEAVKKVHPYEEPAIDIMPRFEIE